jgi:integrase/recombinase XerD
MEQRPGATSTMHLHAALASFLVQLRADGRSPHTVAQYERHVRRLGEWLAGQGLPNDVAQIAPEHLARFLAAAEAERRAAGRSRRPGSLNALRSSLRGFFSYLELAGVLVRNPARLVRMARVGAREPHAMPPRDVERLVATLQAASGWEATRDLALFAFLLATGARLGSATALEVGDLDLRDGAAMLREVKGGGEQRVFLRRDVADLLAALIGTRRTGSVFLGRNGEPLTPRQAQRRFTGWLERAGIRGRYSPHSLRHTFALGLYERTGDVLVVQAALGHRSIASTLVYARASAERVRVAVEGQPQLRVGAGRLS